MRTRSSAWLGGWLCVLLASVVLGSAAAQGPAPNPATQGDPPGYRELVEEAVAEHGAGHFGEARALFLRAHNLYPNARTLKGLGMAEFELRNYRESAQYLEASLASTVKPLTPALKSEAEQLLARARGFLGKVRVMVSPANTQITVDGAVAPFASDGSVLLVAGDHTIEAISAGYEPQHQTIKINGGDDQVVTFQLTPMAGVSDSPPPTAAAALGATTEAQVAPAPDQSGTKPRGFRLYIGGLVGFAGNQSSTAELTSDSLGDMSLEGSDSLAASYGFDFGATFFAVPFFDLGAELRLGWIKPAQGDVDTSSEDYVELKRTFLFDIDIKPRVRFDFAQGRAEFYLAVPVGLTIPDLPGDVISGRVGWNLGAGAGLTYFVAPHVGINFEAMVLFHSYGGSASVSEGGEDAEIDISLFLWQPSLFFNIVIAP